MHAEKASGQVGCGANLIRGFVWGPTENKNIILDHTRYSVHPITFLATEEEVDLQGPGRKERQSDITKAPFHVEAVIVTECILSPLDEIRTGAQGHLELVNFILRHMELDLGIGVTDISCIKAEMIDQFRFRAQAVTVEREVEEPYPFL